MNKAHSLLLTVAMAALASCDSNPFGTLEAEWVADPSSDSVGNNGADAGTQLDTGPSADESDAGAQPEADVPVDPRDLDEDGDGVTARLDCADNDRGVHPGAVEVCNGKDDDCDGNVDDAVDVVRYYDHDGDRHGDPTKEFVGGCTRASFLVNTNDDCDDGDRRTYPGAPEICDNEDNDCDGQTDEGVESKSWCVDADGDGHGDPTKCFQNGCDGASFLVAEATDCDDFNADAHPDADEVCDGADNNCDGATDEGTFITLYRDADGDGFGNALITTQVCAGEPGWVVVNNDCDDTDDEVNPAAEEACNGVDDDCNGKTDEVEPGQNLCDDGNPYTTDMCDGVAHTCVYEQASVEFACELPEGYDPRDFTCGSGYFFETAPGVYAPEVVQAPGGQLVAPVEVVCDRLAAGALLHVNTFAFDPADPFYEWVGGEFTTVIVDGNALAGVPGIVTVFPALDFIYLIDDFGDICAP